MTNCPNCGAVITGPQCEYCGTRFDIIAKVSTANFYNNNKVISENNGEVPKDLKEQLKKVSKKRKKILSENSDRPAMVYEYLEEHYGEDITVSDIATVLDMRIPTVTACVNKMVMLGYAIRINAIYNKNGEDIMIKYIALTV